MSEENEFNMYKNIVNNYFRTETFEKAKEFCARDMVQLNNRYIDESVCRGELLNRVNKLQEENKQLKGENGSYGEVLNAEITDYDTIIEKIDNTIKDIESGAIQCYPTSNVNDFVIDILKGLKG